jgi:hypothetical protein
MYVSQQLQFLSALLRGRKRTGKKKKRLVACFYIKNARFLFSICLIVFINVIITEILVYRQKENYRYHIPFILTNLLNT